MGCLMGSVRSAVRVGALRVSHSIDSWVPHRVPLHRPSGWLVGGTPNRGLVKYHRVLICRFWGGILEKYMKMMKWSKIFQLKSIKSSTVQLIKSKSNHWVLPQSLRFHNSTNWDTFQISTSVELKSPNFLHPKGRRSLFWDFFEGNNFCPQAAGVFQIVGWENARLKEHEKGLESFKGKTSAQSSNFWGFKMSVFRGAIVDLSKNSKRWQLWSLNVATNLDAAILESSTSGTLLVVKAGFSWWFTIPRHQSSYSQLMSKGCPITSETHRSCRFHETILRRWARIPRVCSKMTSSPIATHTIPAGAWKGAFGAGGRLESLHHRKWASELPLGFDGDYLSNSKYWIIWS